MVDPNPARGMPLQLQRYWLAGKGAAKIRWNVPGDFDRCVRALRKYELKGHFDVKGLCNILHTKATGGPPGHGSLEPRHMHSMDGEREAMTLLAAQGVLGSDLWAGPLAPVGRPTGEPSRVRIFEPGSLDQRMLPLPLAHRRMDNMGHMGAVTVGRIMGLTIGPDQNGRDTVWGWGDWLDPNIVPEVTEAKYLVNMGVAGASLDPGGKVSATINPDTGAEHYLNFTIGGATLVRIPAFDGTHLFNLTDGEWPEDDPDMAMPDGAMGEDTGGCGCNQPEVGQSAGQQPMGTYATTQDSEFAVNSDGWQGLPLAGRQSPFDNDEAVQRITAWANGGQDAGKMRQAFLYQVDGANPNDPTSYRLPVGDIINGKLTLVYHAIYAAAALLSGAHGGLPDISDKDKSRLRVVISSIYPEMAKAFNDSSIKAPWDRVANQAAREDLRQAASPPPPGAGQSIQEGDEFAVADNPKQPYGNVEYADPGYQADKKKRYPLDSEEHIRAAWGYINQADNASQYNPAQLKLVKAKIMKAMKKIGAEVENDADEQGPVTAAAGYFVSDEGYPLEPPAAWFENPDLKAKTPLTVTPEGRVFGHLAAWNECHRDVTNKACVLAPKSRKDYAPFHLGSVFTSDGNELRVGKIVMDTRHADINLGYAAAAIHYDNTGDEIVICRAGEDQFGIYVAGSVVPEADRRRVAKLRRSPLSGDWRAVDGNLELTAALAVNVPAFPVYAMEGEDRLALVAAGSIWNDFYEEDEKVEDVKNAFDSGDKGTTEPDESQDDRGWLLRELLDEEEMINQWNRGHQLNAIFAADGSEPLAVPDNDPVYGTQAMLTRQADAKFSIIEEAAPAPIPAPTGA